MNRKGFSLIELLIVIVIIGIIVIIAVPSLLESKKTSQETAALATLRAVAGAETAYSAKPVHQIFGSVANLASEHFLDERFNSGVAHYNGYTFGGSSTTRLFTINAVADDTSSPNFYIDQSLSLHYSNGTPVGK